LGTIVTVATSADRRVFFVGESYVVGVGDPGRRGWIGRLAEWSDRDGAPVTVYNLGVRRDTSEDIRRRWAGEVAVRRVAGSEDRMVLAFGVNDTTDEGGGTRVPPDRSLSNLEAIVEEATASGLPVLVVGPPPIADPRQNRRIARLDERLRECAARLGAPYVPVFAALLRDPIWMDEVARGDGAHPGAEGYTRLAELVRPTWRSWIRGG
jgi:lysophospholipase L1-like esterase